MILNQEQIRRMTNGGSSVVVGGGSGAGSGDGITMAWVEANYVSKEFFSRLFKAYDSEATPNEVLPNDLESTITNIKLMFGTWTEQYLSALGQSAGGSSGASALVDLTDVAISSPTDGQVLTYDANLGKWVNRAAGGGGSGISMSDVWDAMGGSTSEQINESHLTNALANYVTSSDISDMATETWCNNRFLTSETYTGTVTSVRVRATSPVQSSVSTAQTASLDTTISLSDGYGDSKNPYGSKTKNYVLASPAGANGMPSFRALVAADIPSLSWSKITSGKPTTLSGYGITDAMLIKSLATTDNIDTLYDAGSYRFSATAQGTWPTGVTANYGEMLVVHGGGDTVAQIFFPYNSSAAYLRNGNPVNGGSWQGWKQIVTPDMNVASATKLATARTLWGQSFDGTANVSGDMTSVGSITMSGSITMNNNTAVRMKDNSGNTVSIMTIDSGGNFVIGETVDIYGHNTYIRGAHIIFQQGTTSANRKELFRIDSTGNLHMKQYNTFLSMQSSANDEYNVLTLNTNPNAEQSVWHLALGYGTAGVDYGTRIFGGATTGIKFLCGQTTEVASIYKDSSRQGIKIGDALLSWDSGNNALKVSKIDGQGNEVAANFYSLGGVSGLGAWTGSNGDLTVTGVTATGDIQGANLIATTKVTSPKFYFDSSRYLFLDGTTLKFNNNGTIKTVVLS